MQKPTIYFHSNIISPRVTYTIDFIFKQVLHWDVHVSSDISEIPKNSLFINYSEENYSNALHIFPHGLLFQNGIDPTVVTSMHDVVDKIKTGNFNVDIFSFIFFCISRYEEYVDGHKDKMGRFISDHSILYDNNHGLAPWVDITIRWIFETLNNKYPSHELTSGMTYKLISTVDIDQAWQYANKGVYSVAGVVKSLIALKFKNSFYRLKSIFKPASDPYYQYETIDKFHIQNDIPRPIYFFLLAKRRNTYDKNHKSSNRALIRLIKGLSQNHTIGIHPSYRSHKNIKILKSEKASLEKILNTTVEHSRQHYLKMNIPSTYRSLLEIGIHHDYSMGYADRIGYRAGTGYAYLWYDLENERVTELWVHPFQVMDVTLQKYMGLKTNEAMEYFKDLVKMARQYHTPLSILWHNSSLCDQGVWKGWKGVYAYFLKIGK
ncbi:MAG: polysaccharide deacetylase family protein [Saprospiraceae bacterium]|nr:polysaccharide deacetylase family protein [Saprospiraceae bacterium]